MSVSKTDAEGCVICGAAAGDDVTHYEGVYVSGGTKTIKRFCSLPCATRNAYGQVEQVELPGGKTPPKRISNE